MHVALDHGLQPTEAALSRDFPALDEGAKFGTTFFSTFVTLAER